MKSPMVMPVLGVLLLIGCRPSVGSSCKPDESRCLDKATQLSCENSRFKPTACKGPGGCVASEKGVLCDISGNKPGDVCAASDEGAASCVEDHRMIVCRGGKYLHAECRGEKGCENEGLHAVCDTSIAVLGDACNKPASKACSKDRKQVLACQSGKMEFLYQCRGEKGCDAAGSKLNCDVSVARLDDVCDKTMEGQNACSEDKKNIVVCRSGRFVVDEKCKAGTNCSSEGGISCAKKS